MVMSIISLSINDKLLEEMDRVMEESGYTGRSEIIRASIRNFISEIENNHKLSGKLKAVLLVVLNKHAGSFITEIKHKFEKITSIQIHLNLNEKRCLELFVLDGNASEIKKLIKTLHSGKHITKIKLIIP